MELPLLNPGYQRTSIWVEYDHQRPDDPHGEILNGLMLEVIQVRCGVREIDAETLRPMLQNFVKRSTNDFYTDKLLRDCM